MCIRDRRHPLRATPAAVFHPQLGRPVDGVQRQTHWRALWRVGKGIVDGVVDEVSQMVGGQTDNGRGCLGLVHEDRRGSTLVLSLSHIHI